MKIFKKKQANHGTTGINRHQLARTSLGVPTYKCWSLGWGIIGAVSPQCVSKDWLDGFESWNTYKCRPEVMVCLLWASYQVPYELAASPGLTSIHHVLSTSIYCDQPLSTIISHYSSSNLHYWIIFKRSWTIMITQPSLKKPPYY